MYASDKELNQRPLLSHRKKPLSNLQALKNTIEYNIPLKDPSENETKKEKDSFFQYLVTLKVIRFASKLIRKVDSVKFKKLENSLKEFKLKDI